jgi:TRAP-type C4-dicarboxylate transport system permease small subunit
MGNMSDERYQVAGSLSAAERAAMVAQVEEQARLLELADPDEGQTPFDRSINRAVEFVGVATLGTVATLVFINATLRYTISRSLVWGDELVISLIPLLAFTGLFLSVRRRRVVRIETFLEMIPARVRAPITAVGHLVSTFVFLYLGYYAISYLQLFGRDPMVYFDLPKGVFQSAMAFGALLVALAFALQAWRAFRRS